MDNIAVYVSILQSVSHSSPIIEQRKLFANGVIFSDNF